MKIIPLIFAVNTVIITAIFFLFPIILFIQIPSLSFLWGNAVFPFINIHGAFHTNYQTFILSGSQYLLRAILHLRPWH